MFDFDAFTVRIHQHDGPEFIEAITSIVGGSTSIVQSIVEDPSRAIASTVLLMAGTEADTPESRALIGRYVERFKIKVSFNDAIQAMHDRHMAEAEVIARGDSVASPAKTAMTLLNILRAYEAKVFAEEQGR